MNLKMERRCYKNSTLNNLKLKFLLILGLWTSNLIIYCQALPRPDSSNDEDFRRNFAADYGAPLIRPLEDHVILEKDSNYTIRCEANEPIEWKVAHEFLDFKSETFPTLDPERPFGSLLYLSNINYEYVGSYYCIKKSSLENNKNVLNGTDEEIAELVNNNQASTIYLFVNDTENLLAPINFPIAYAQQYQDTTIPCKPTMPNVVVLLTTPNGAELCNFSKSHEFKDFSPNITFSSSTYNPKTGFRLKMVENVTELYLCCIASNQTNGTEINIVFSQLVKIRPTLVSTINLVSITSNVHSKSILTKNVVLTNRIVTTIAYNINKNKIDFVNDHNSNVVITDGVGFNDEQLNQIYTTALPSNTLTFDNNLDVETTTTAISNDFVTTDSSFEYEDESFEHELNDIENNSVQSFSNESTTFGDVGLVEKSFPKKRAVHTTASPRRSSFIHNYSTRRSSTKYINKPQITSKSNGHAYIGDTFQLICEVEVVHDVRFTFAWTTPPDVDKNRIVEEKATIQNHTVTHKMGRSALNIKNAQKTDTGMYKCTVTDNTGNNATNLFLMTILDINESYINISEPNNHYNIVERAGNLIKINVKYRGHPKPSLTWHKPDGTQIQPTQKYQIETTDSAVTLTIMNTKMLDSGEYVIKATNGIVNKELKFNVSIQDAPVVTVEDVYVQVGEEAHVTCRVLSYPIALVSWVFTPCEIKPRWPSCLHKFEQSFNSTRSARPGRLNIEFIHDLYFTPKEPGIMHCIAQNKQNRTIGKGHVLVGDLTDNMTVNGVDENRKIARGGEVIITCAALAYYFSNDLYWYKDGEEVKEGPNLEISNATSEFSYKKSLKFKSIQDADRGSYECRAVDVLDYTKTESKYLNIFVHEPAVPKITYTNMDTNKIERKLGDALELECKSEAIPRANVDWYKGNVKLNANKDIAIEEDNTKIIIPYIKPEDEGTYKCVVANRLGSLEKITEVVITNMPGLSWVWIVVAALSFIVLFVCLVILFLRYKRERRQLKELKAAGLANFEEGAVEHINPALTLDEQADLLPYDRNFEFPREKLKLGKQLGAGAFGVVLKAHAEGIKPEEKESIVAVKMVKRSADNEVMRALVSELKIMVHLGQHLNVVNLLGAVTKSIAKRELMVIVEYCRYGNVQNFLLRNRKRFIDQINPETDKIDSTIMTQRFSDNFEFNRNSDNDPRSGTRAGRPNSKGYARRSDSYEGPVNSCATEQTIMTTIPEDEDHILSNNSIQPAWRSNYKPDSTEAMTVTTSDLVSWAFQVARGMDYLASRQVLHGDLAARNILLCEENVVKICDFGLARSMYKRDNYKKQGEAPLPIKWLALESLSDHIFNTYTDVWSFGIVLWEFFSLAKVPYPGMDPNQSLFLKLKDGYRMEKPPFANDELYDIMLRCWSTNPESRPLFNQLEKEFARMLGDDVTNHYLDLNEPYLRVNTDARRSQTDYLALMGSPEELAPPPPRYVNGLILPEIRIDLSSDDYLQMSTNSDKAIFSPTRPKDIVMHSDLNESTANSSFTFPDLTAEQNSPTLTSNLNSPLNKNRRKDIVQPEEIPMLQSTHHHTSGSDAEQSPEQPRKFSNILQQTRTTPTPSPRHHIETQLNGNGNDDNYVNVKSPKKQTNGSSQSTSRTTDAYSNPSYQPLKTGIDSKKTSGHTE